MNGRRVVDFIVLRSAFSQRNVTSLLLVGVFFAVYVLSGGKITTSIPHMKDANGFGDAGLSDTSGTSSTSTPDHSLQVLGVTSTAEQQARQETVNKRGRLFDPEIDAVKEGEVDKNGLLHVDTTNEKEELKLRKFERRDRDSLAAIEERLKIKRNK